MRSLAEITSCLSVTDADMADATEDGPAAAASALGLLRRMAEVAKPKQGAPKIMMLLARIAGAPWLEGVLEVRVQADADWSMIDLFLDNDTAVRRFAPSLLVGAPVSELLQSVQLQPTVVEPLELQAGATPSRFRLRANRSSAGRITVRPVAEPPPAKVATPRPPAPTPAPAPPKPAAARPLVSGLTGSKLPMGGSPLGPQAGRPAGPAGALAKPATTAPRPPTAPAPAAPVAPPSPTATKDSGRRAAAAKAAAAAKPAAPAPPPVAARPAPPSVPAKTAAPAKPAEAVVTEAPDGRRVTKNTAATIVRKAPLKSDVTATVKVEAMVIPREAIPGMKREPPKHLSPGIRIGGPVPRDEEE